MRKIIKIFIVSFFLLLFSYNYSAAQDAAGNDAVERLNNRVLSYFQPSTGRVTEVDGDTVLVSVDDNKGLVKGTRLTVYRQGDPFHHPVTGELIGSTEDLTGLVEVGDDMSNGSYRVSVIKGDIKSGDTVRISLSKVKLAFFQAREADWSVSEDFYRSLKDTGRFDIKEKYTPDTSREALIGISKEIGAEIMLFLSTPLVDNKKQLRVEMFWVEDSKQLSEVTAEISSEYIHELTRFEDFIAKSFVDKEPWSTFEFDKGRLFAVGDINGDGMKELVVSNGSSISIYDMQKEMQEIWTVENDLGGRHLSIDLLDLNGNGRDEIFITSIMDEDIASDLIGEGTGSSTADDGTISSFVIEYDPAEGYKKISADLPFFMRVTAGKLLMQRFTVREVLSTPVFTGKWEDGQYKQAAQLELPKGVNIYGFAYIDWKKDGNLHVMSIDDKGFLNMYRKGELVWRSEETYGVPAISFKKLTPSIISDKKEWLIRGRLIVVNSDKGQQVIMVKRNQLLSKVPRLGSFSAEIYTLKWNGSVMDEELMLRGVSGTVFDYWVEGRRLYLLAKSGLFAFAKKAVKGEFARSSVLYYFNFEER